MSAARSAASLTGRTRYLAGAASLLSAVAVLAGAAQTGTAAAATPLANPMTASVINAPPVDPTKWAPLITDDFNGTSVNTSTWSVFDAPTGQRHHVARNVVEANGFVSLKTVVDPVTGAWTTAGMCACKTTTQTYGRYDMRMRLSAGDSRAVALLWGANSWPPEIDFAEFGASGPKGGRQSFTQTVHYGTSAQNYMIHNLINADMTQWHTVTLEWAPGQVLYFLDGVPAGSATTSNIPLTPMWLGLVTSNTQGGTPTQSVDFDIDSIDVYSYIGGVAGAPTAPTAVTATSGDSAATVNWTPGSDGNSPVTAYTVTAMPGGATTTVFGANGTAPITAANFTNLTPGISYTFTVSATNSFGTSPVSGPSAPVTVTGAPPTITIAPTPAIVRGVVGSNATSTDLATNVGFATAPGSAPVCSNRLQRSINGGSWTGVTLRSGYTTAKDLLPAAGTTVQYEAQATGCNGLVSAWTTGPALTYRLTDDKDPAVAYTGGWATSACSTCVGGSTHSSSSRNDTAAVTLPSASAFGVFAPVGPTHGAVKVYVDGVFVTNAATYATKAQARQLVYIGTFAAPGPHVVTLVNAASPGHPRVDLDGVVSLG